MRTFPCLALALLLATRIQAQTGSISGTLKTEDGKAVTALVRLSPTMNSPARPRSIATAKDGSFSFSGVPAGAHELCATVSSGSYIDPCLWDASGVLVRIAAGQTVSGVTITVKKASTLKVHVDDPAQLIQGSRAGAIVLGVFVSGHRFHPLVRQNANGSGKDYSVAVPFDQDFVFTMRPKALAVLDANHSSVDNGHTLHLRHPSGGPTPAVQNYQVTGGK